MKRVTRVLVLASLAALTMGCASSGTSGGGGGGSAADAGLFSTNEPRLLPVAPETSPVHGSLEVAVTTGYRDLDRVQLAAN